MGEFMSKQLKLRGFRDYCLSTYDAPKPLNQDEDNIASQYKDEEGWTIHRKRAWTALLTGNHYDYIDFSIIPWLETGTPCSQRCIRTWMKHLSSFIHAQDLANARPLPSMLKSVPNHTIGVAFGVEGKDICIYIADERELPSARDLPDDQAAGIGPGTQISGDVVVDLTEATYRVSAYDPKTGASSPAIEMQCGAKTILPLPPFIHDMVIKIVRQ